MKLFPGLLCLGLCLLLSCGLGPSLKTLNAAADITEPNTGMNIQLPRGDITVLADGPAGSTGVTARLEVYNRGISGITFSPASIDDIDFTLSAVGMVSVSLERKRISQISPTPSKCTFPRTTPFGRRAHLHRTTSSPAKARSTSKA